MNCCVSKTYAGGEGGSGEVPWVLVLGRRVGGHVALGEK